MSDTNSFENPRAVLKRHGMRPKRSWGQNFLVSSKAVAVIADACLEACPVDAPVVEIGAGVGTLTAVLLARGARVTAIERDRDMCEVLRVELGAHDRFSLLEADAASVDYASFFQHEKGAVVGNLPYQLTGRLIRLVVATAPCIHRGVLMVQQEVAERLSAAPGEKARGALSAIVQARFDVRIIHRLKPTAFFPPPKVRSAVVSFSPRESTVFERGISPDAYDAMVNAAFTGRRKTLRNSLLSAGMGAAAEVESLLAAAGIDARLRPERLSVEDFAGLVDAQSRG